MREHPILFNGDMVRAILAGTKTQTRRPAPIKALSFTHHPEGLIAWAVQFMKAVKGVLASYSGGSFTEEVARSIIASQFCPFGQPGDRLWVRETWASHPCGGTQRHDPGDGHAWGSPIYRATFGAMLKPTCEGFTPWRPSIHMPRWACRIVLEIVSVRVERVQEISEQDATAEGANWDARMYPMSFYFKKLWDSVYAAKGQGWDANPWVWVVEFKRTEVSA